MATNKKLVKTQAQIDKLIKSQRKTATELCITLAKDLVGRMGEDKLKEKLEDDTVIVETKNYFDSAETIEDTPTENIITGVRELGVKVEDGYTDDKEIDFKWHELETETIMALADRLADIHEEVQNHI
jgi:hypothetical protein